MRGQKYNWNRFWFPRGENINFDGNGYLYNPNSQYGSYLNGNLVSIDILSSAQCLILLGEPGIGKTSELDKYYITEFSRIKKEGNHAVNIDLSIYDSGAELRKELNDAIKIISGSKDKIYLFIDSLDEGMLNIKVISQLLIQFFDSNINDYNQIFVRITCRTAEWQSSGLEGEFKRLWPKDIQIYELAPLLREDIIEAAKVEKIDENSFLQEIENRDCIPLAIMPITLVFLLELFLSKGTLPNNKVELYFEGCKILCEEQNPLKKNANHSKYLDTEQRVSVIERIAAAMVFTNKNSVYLKTHFAADQSRDLVIDNLYGTGEIANGAEFNVGKNEILEALQTGLFNSLGAERLGWSHRQYAEFLAAHYLVRHKVPFHQIRNLLINPSDNENSIAPQLYETTAWLACMDSNAFRQIIDICPMVLLRSDVYKADEADIEKLVESLLNMFDNDLLIDDIDIRRDYLKLFHSKLASQLRPYIINKEKGVIIRRVAINIAEACNVRELQDDIFNIVLDNNQFHNTRENAASAIMVIADVEVKLKLKAALLSSELDDPDDTIRGYVFDALYPEHMTSAELFSHLSSPQNDKLFGSYALFIQRKLPSKLDKSALIDALRWVKDLCENGKIEHEFHDTADAIVDTAWENINEPRIREGIIDVLLSDANKNYSHRYFDEKVKDTEKRRDIINGIIDKAKSVKDLCGFIYMFANNEDFWWYVEKIMSEEDSKGVEIIADLLWVSLNRSDEKQINEIIKLKDTFAAIESRFQPLLGAVEIGSIQATNMKNYYQARMNLRKIEGEQKSKKPLEPPPIKLVEDLLDEFDAGQLDAWCKISYYMTLDIYGAYKFDEVFLDFTKQPVWEVARLTTKERLINAAKKYLIGQTVEKAIEGSETNLVFTSASAGYKALLLLRAVKKHELKSIPKEVWDKWGPVIINCSVSSGTQEEEANNDIISLAYEKSPEAVIHALIKTIEKENEASEYCFSIRRIENCWDDNLSACLLRRIKQGDLKPKINYCILTELIKRQFSEAIEYAKESLGYNGYEDASYMEAVYAASLLMLWPKTGAWDEVWRAFISDTRFGQDIILEVASNYEHTGDGLINYSESQLTNLFVWIERQYPHNKYEGFVSGFYDSIDHIVDFRDRIIEHLVIRGSKEACKSIEIIHSTFPELDYLKWSLIRAKQNANRKSWNPPSPKEIIQLVHDSNRRFVQSGEQLQDIILESFERLEEKLHGETPAVKYLWNERDGLWRPRDENDFSDYVKNHLETDLKGQGIIVNREVEIRRGIHSSDGKHIKGQRTDIYISAINKANDDVITVIVEVKGCWHRELMTAMKTQLCEQYLKNNSCRYGLYLAGWYCCNLWDGSDSRKSNSPKISKEKVHDYLKEQAQSLSVDGLNIKSYILDTRL